MTAMKQVATSERVRVVAKRTGFFSHNPDEYSIYDAMNIVGLDPILGRVSTHLVKLGDWVNDDGSVNWAGAIRNQDVKHVLLVGFNDEDLRRIDEDPSSWTKCIPSQSLSTDRDLSPLLERSSHFLISRDSTAFVDWFLRELEKMVNGSTVAS